MRQGKFADAKEVLGKAAALQPAEPLIPLDLANVSEEMGDKEAAVEQYKSAIALEGDNVTAHFRLAKLLQSMGRRDEAKVEFAKARSLNLKTDEGLYKRIEAARTGPPRVGTEPVGSDGAATPTPQ
jgi:tetratricopeptide (TPR) repeat protein